MKGPANSSDRNSTVAVKTGGDNGLVEAPVKRMLDRWRERDRKWDAEVYYPAILDLNGRKCLVVGAGDVGEEKIDGLLTANAEVTVVAQEASDTVKKWAGNGLIDLNLRSYSATDLEGCFLVIAATEDTQINQAVYEEAEKRGLLCNVVDSPSLCNFILPSIYRNDDLIISISTGGASPALARKIRIEISGSYGDEHADMLKILGSLRVELKARYPDYRDRKILLERIVYSDLLEWIKEGRTDEIEEWVSRCIEDGPDYASEDDHRSMISAALNGRTANPGAGGAEQ